MSTLAAENRILELGVPKNSGPAEMSIHPTNLENGADSGSEKLSSRPWCQFWRVNAGNLTTRQAREATRHLRACQTMGTGLAARGPIAGSTRLPQGFHALL